MAIYINDLTIENDPYDYGRYRISYKDREIMVPCYEFNKMYDTLEHEQIYKFIIKNFFHENPDMMYDEYFGTDSYDVERETERIKKSKIKQFESGVQGVRDKDKKPTPKQVNYSKLQSSFWGRLIIEDTLNVND